MKKTLILAAFALAALPAMAATTTVEFAPAEGDKLVAVFSDDGTVSFNGGEPVAYTSDEAGKTICSSVNGGIFSRLLSCCTSFIALASVASGVRPILSTLRIRMFFGVCSMSMNSST